MAKLVTMSDIAGELGVSIVSVSKALSGKDGVSETTRELILAKARELGYVFSTSSKMANPDQKYVIGVLVAARFFDENTFYNKLYCDFLNECSIKGYSVMLEIVTSQNENEATLPKLIKDNLVDGVVFMGEMKKQYIQRVISQKIPYIFLDFFNDELVGDVVIGDNIHGGYAMAREIIESGKKKIGFVGSIRQTSSIMDRFLGMVKAINKLGGETRGDWVVEDRDEEGILTSLKLPDELPEGFVCSCDQVAYTLINQLQERGIRVPEDVAVTGYDDFRFSTIAKPALTTYQVDTKAMAHAAYVQMKGLLHRKKVTKDSIVVEGKMIVRDSV